MKKIKVQKSKNREGEKGSAMVMVLLLSVLMLTASVGLLLETTMNTANVTDATAEQQAYNAAESGIQSTINALRGNVTANPLIDSTMPETKASKAMNQISFAKAITPALSNKPGEESLSPRLSRWIPYSSTFTDRVPVGETAAIPYTKQSGYAFSLAISDPDNTGTLISYTTDVSTTQIFNSDPGSPRQQTWNSIPSAPAGTARVVYSPVTVDDLNVSSGTANTNIGTFTFSTTGAGAEVFGFSRFEITVRMTKPYDAKRVIRGYIETGFIKPGQITSKIIFDSQTFTLMGSNISLSLPSGTNVYVLSPKPQRVGYEAPFSLGTLTVGASMTPAEPTRLLISSTGYGPRGAIKRIDAVIQKNFFDGLAAPATLTLVGPRSTIVPVTSFLFNPGSSNVTQYSGDDVVSTDIIPPIGTTNSENLDIVEESVDGQPPHPFNGTVVGTPSDVLVEMPEWLQNPLKLDTAVQSLFNVARSSGRYYPLGQNPTNVGDNGTAKGITFVDHDFELEGAGGGILVVTGKLTLKGNFSFNGLIIVTGQGGVDRSGGGNGTIQGNIVVAPYLNSRIIQTPATATTPDIYVDKSGIIATTSFLSPQYNLSGGGNSTIVYNSSSVGNGLNAISNFVLGVAEK